MSSLVKSPIKAGLLNFNLALSAVAAFYVPFASAALTAEQLTKKVEDTKSALTSAKSESARVGAVKKFQDFIEESLEALPATNPDDETRQLRTSLRALDIFVGEIETHDFKSRDCEDYRSAILSNGGPVREPASVFGEEKEALSLLALACKNPDLAQLPQPESESD